MTVERSLKATFPAPARVTLTGAYAVLEPLDPDKHGAELFESSRSAGAEERFRYLGQPVPLKDEFFAWLEGATSSSDPLFFAVVDKATGLCHGRQALMRIAPEHGVVELGNILWNPAVARTRVATEAFFLAAAYAFDELGYRRFEWKCDAENTASRRAAERFGFSFEGEFKQHMIVKGKNRDTAWFAMLDHEWPAIRGAFEAWLEPQNFDEAGQQHRSLVSLRNAGPNVGAAD